MKREYKQDFSTAAARSKHHILVTVTGLDYEPVPMEVRDEHLRSLGMAMTEHSITLDEGKYALRVLLPDGDVEVITADVSEGQPERYTVKWQSSTSLAAQLETKSRIKSVRKGEPSTAWYARIVSYENGQWTPRWDAADLEVIKHSYQNEISATEILVHGQYVGLHFLEVRNQNGRTTCSALPIAAQSDAMTGGVLVIDSGEAIDITASLRGSERVQLVSEYVQSGSLQEALDIIGQAEDLLWGKMSNPVAAALGGYALLRQGNLERLHNWPMNLASWFDWLPDGAVIAGELVARRGDHPSAANFFLLAIRRGLPIFNEGFSTLLSRVRYYALYAKDLLLDGYSSQHISGALTELQKWAYAVDHTTLVLTLNDTSLIGEDVGPEYKPHPDRGWHKFNPHGQDYDFWINDF
jgi:hypothetical protein